MTQDVQPLTWQKRTNIEEHMQFFSKINEIIDNLAPTVDEAEAAIAQATTAIADANAAIATANAASSAASAAAQQAQTAAATVAGYDARLTAVESEADTNAGNITALQGRMGTAEGNITALQNVQPDYVKKAGAAQTVTSQIMVPTTATGIRDTQIANGTRIQNDLDAYEQMVRTTGRQTIPSEKLMPNINNNRHEVVTDSYGAGWRKVYEWVGQATFMVMIRSQTGSRRNGSSIIVSVSVGSAVMIGDGSSWNELSKIAIGTSTTKQVAIASNADGSAVGFYYNFPNSETTVIEIIGSVKASNRTIYISPVAEDPTALPHHLVV